MYTENQIILLRGCIQHTIMSHIDNIMSQIGNLYSELYVAMCDEIISDDLIVRVGDTYSLSQNLQVNGQFDFEAFSKIISENLKLTVKSYITNENAISNIYTELPAIVRDVIQDIKKILNL